MKAVHNVCNKIQFSQKVFRILYLGGVDLWSCLDRMASFSASSSPFLMIFIFFLHWSLSRRQHPFAATAAAAAPSSFFPSD